MDEKPDNIETRESLKDKLKRTVKEVEELGGMTAFKSGDWLLSLVRKSLRNYWERANPGYLREKYPSRDDAFIIGKLTGITAKNAALIGGLTGALVSADEVVGIFTGFAGGVGLPANIAVAATAIAGEAVLLIRFQLKLVANIGRLLNVPLDPDDPEDIFTILAFAVGGSVSESAGKLGMKVGSKLTEKMIKKYISRDVLEAIKRVFAKMGIKILQRTILKYVVPVASIGIGSGWNYVSTRAIAKVAVKHFEGRLKDLNSNKDHSDQT